MQLQGRKIAILATDAQQDPFEFARVWLSAFGFDPGVTSDKDELIGQHWA